MVNLVSFKSPITVFSFPPLPSPFTEPNCRYHVMPFVSISEITQKLTKGNSIFVTSSFRFMFEGVGYRRGQSSCGWLCLFLDAFIYRLTRKQEIPQNTCNIFSIHISSEKQSKINLVSIQDSRLQYFIPLAR
jgi:hypothetical protein